MRICDIDKLLILRSPFICAMALSAGIVLSTEISEEGLLAGDYVAAEFLPFIDTSKATLQIDELTAEVHETLVLYANSTLSSMPDSLWTPETYALVDYWFGGKTRLYQDYCAVTGHGYSMLRELEQLPQYTLFDKNIRDWPDIISSNLPMNMALFRYFHKRYIFTSIGPLWGYIDKTKDTMEGIWDQQFPNGEYTSCNFENDLEHGVRETRFAGVLVDSTPYYHGEIHGLVVKYSSRGNGQIVETRKYTHGVEDGLHELFYKDGRIKQREMYIAGKREGCWERYNKEGVLYESKEYRDDKLNGLYKDSYNIDCITRIATYVDNVRQGPYTRYYDDGKTLYKTGQYTDGVKSGIWTIYNDDGSPNHTVDYAAAKGRVIDDEDEDEDDDEYEDDSDAEFLENRIGSVSLNMGRYWG